MSKRTIIVVGETRSGKSSLCNVLKGDRHSSMLFPVSFGLESVTEKTSIVHTFFRGNEDRPVTIIDTKGIVDPNHSEAGLQERNERVQSEILHELSKIDGVNLFVICWNGQNPRLTASLVEMLKILQDMFGHRSDNGISIPDPQQFWGRCVISYSRVSWDESSIRIRERQREHETREYDMRDAIAMHFAQSRGIEVVYIDALYDAQNKVELSKFDEETEKLYTTLLQRDPLPIAAIQNLERDREYSPTDSLLSGISHSTSRTSTESILIQGK